MIFRSSQRFDHLVGVGDSFPKRLEETQAHCVVVVVPAITNIFGELRVEIVQLNVLDPARGQLENFDRVRAGEDEMPKVETDSRFGPDQEPFDVVRSLDGASEPRLDREAQLVPRANVLDGSDRMEKVGPFRIGQHDAVLRASRSLRYRRKDQGLGAEGGEPLRVAVDVSELCAADVVVVEDGVHLSSDKAQPVALEQRFGLVAAIWQKSRRPRRDRAFAHRRGLGEHPFRIELVPPAGDIADPPAHRRDRQAVRRTG